MTLNSAKLPCHSDPHRKDCWLVYDDIHAGTIARAHYADVVIKRSLLKEHCYEELYGLVRKSCFWCAGHTRSHYCSHDECYKLQTEWFEATESVYNKFRTEDDLKESVCSPTIIEKVIQIGQRIGKSRSPHERKSVRG